MAIKILVVHRRRMECITPSSGTFHKINTSPQCPIVHSPRLLHCAEVLERHDDPWASCLGMTREPSTKTSGQWWSFYEYVSLPRAFGPPCFPVRPPANRCRPRPSDCGSRHNETRPNRTAPFSLYGSWTSRIGCQNKWLEQRLNTAANDANSIRCHEVLPTG